MWCFQLQKTDCIQDSNFSSPAARANKCLPWVVPFRVPTLSRTQTGTGNDMHSFNPSVNHANDCVYCGRWGHLRPQTPRPRPSPSPPDRHRPVPTLALQLNPLQITQCPFLMWANCLCNLLSGLYFFKVRISAWRMMGI